MPELSGELRACVDGLDNPVSRPWCRLAVRLTRDPRQRGQDHAPTGSFLGRLDQEFLQRNIDVDIVELEIEGCLHVGRADEARRGGIILSHPPQLLAFSEGHLPLVVAARDGAFDRHFSGNFPHVTTIEQGDSSDVRAEWPPHPLLPARSYDQRLDGCVRNAASGQTHPVRVAGNRAVSSHGCKLSITVAVGVAIKPGCRASGRILYFRFSSQGCNGMTLYGYARVSVREPDDKNLDL